MQDLQQKAKELQKSVEQLGDTKFNNIARGATGARKHVNDLYKAVQKLDRIGKVSTFFGGGVAATAGINALGKAMAGASNQVELFGKTFELIPDAVRETGLQFQTFTQFIDPLVQGLQNIGAQGQAVAAGLGIASAVAVAFAPQLQALGAAARPIAEQFGRLRNKLLDYVEGSKQAIQFTGGYRDLIRSVSDNIANLTTRQQNAKRALNGLNSTSEEAAQVARTLVSLNNRLNKELASQETLLKNAANAQRQFNDQAKVRANVAQSSFARQGSGFAAFSQAAAVIPDAAAIDKSIRRYRDRIAKAFKGMQPIEFPLALPSSEMLNASERGIQQLSSFYGDLNTEIDTGVQAGRQFTEQLKTQAARAQGLPPIFNDVGRALEATVTTTKNVFTNTEKTKEAVTDTAKLRGDVVEAALKEGKVQKGNTAIIKKQNQLLEKRKQMMSGALGGALIGGAFPLLFGQGLGASLGGIFGGGVGGAMGGQLGMGLSLVGTSIGGFFDRIGEKAVTLGQALQPLTADLDELVDATGVTGTETGALIRKLRDAGDEAGALEAATRQMALIVGEDGVIAMKNFGDETQELGRQWNVLMTQMASQMAALLQGPVAQLTRGVTVLNAMEIARKSDDPVAKGLVEKIGTAQLAISKDPMGGAAASKELVKLQNQLLAAVNELQIKRNEEIKKIKETTDVSLVQYNLQKAQNALAKVGNDLTDEQVFKLSKAVVAAETYVALEGIRTKGKQAEIDADTILRGEQTKLLDLTRRRDEALERQADKEERLKKAAERKAASAAKEARSAKAAIAAAQIQGTLADRMQVLQRAIGEARLKGNEAAARSLEIEAILEQKAARIAQIKASTADKATKDAQIAAAAAEAQQQLDKGSFERRQQLKDRAKALADIKAGLDLELQSAQAISAEQQDQLRLEEIALQFKANGKDLTAAERLELQGKIADIRQANEALKEQEFIQNNLNTLVNAAGQQFSGLFQTLIRGTNDWNAAISNVLNSLANALIKFGLNAIAYDGPGKQTGFFSILAGTFGGFMANGGSVTPGNSYIVGEKGPELFTPGAKGNIIPNNAMGGSNIVVNVDAGGSNVQGDGNQAKALGAAIGLAVQNEIIKQKKPGGLLY